MNNENKDILRGPIYEKIVYEENNIELIIDSIEKELKKLKKINIAINPKLLSLELQPRKFAEIVFLITACLYTLKDLQDYSSEIYNAKIETRIEGHIYLCYLLNKISKICSEIPDFYLLMLNDLILYKNLKRVKNSTNNLLLQYELLHDELGEYYINTFIETLTPFKTYENL
jgi:hypothetical protein